MKYPFGISFCLLLMGVLMSEGVMARDGWSVGIGTYSSKGDYGKETDTTIHMVPVAIAYKSGQWQYKVSTGYLSLEGERVLVDKLGTKELVNETGIGDTVVSIKHRFKKISDSPLYLNVGAKVKFPTADEDKKLGTGKHDLELKAGAYWGFQRWWAVSELSYKVREEPSNTQLNNTAQVVVGGLKRIGKRNTVGANLKFREKSQPTKDPVKELISFVNHKLDKNNNVTVLVIKGFTDASPDWGLNTQWRYSF